MRQAIAYPLDQVEPAWFFFFHGDGGICGHLELPARMSEEPLLVSSHFRNSLVVRTGDRRDLFFGRGLSLTGAMQPAPVLAISLMVGQFAGAAPEAPLEPGARVLGNALGLRLNEYAFSWKGEDFSSWQILVASDEKKLAADVGDLWDSGRRTGKKGRDSVPYLGRPLKDGARVWWKVRGFDRENAAGAWSVRQELRVPALTESQKRIHRPGGIRGKIRYVEGRDGQALGMSRAVQVWSEDYPALRSEQATSIVAWIKPEQVGDGWQCLYRKEDGGHRRLVAIGADGGEWGVWCGFNIGGKYVEFVAPCARETLGDGEWHHVAVTFDGRKLRTYLDGRKIGEKQQAGRLGGSGAARAYLGSSGGAQEHFEGALDEVAVYATALSDTQVLELVEGNPRKNSPVPVGHWKFENVVRNEATVVREENRNCVVAVGGTLVARMERYGYLEQAITVHWPQHDIAFRNLGWPADDVFGTARSEFGSAHNTRSWQPPKGQNGYGFAKLKGQLEDAKPSTILVGYGGEAAFADTAEKMALFQAGYRGMVEELEQTGAKLILLTPIRQAASGKVLSREEAAVRNGRLSEAARFIVALGRERRHETVDLITKSPFGPEAGACYENGMHLSELGYRKLASRLSEQFGIGGTPTLAAKVENREQTRLGVRYDLTRDSLPVGMEMPDEAAGKGKLRVWIDGEEVRVSEDNRILSGPDHEQSEKLRQVIIEKNKLHRYKLNPINKAYIFLFRRHEMGHLAYEMQDFDELVKGKEQAIAKLRMPQAHRYEHEEPREWKPPRDYPDHEVPKNIPAPDVDAELKAFKVADGFKVNLWAGNPVIFNPINLNWDRHNRAWVSTSSTYPHIKPGRIPNDRIVILEDTDRDGVADKHTVFAEGLTVPHSVMPVEGGAYVCSTTEVLFLADHDGDDRADEKRVLFSGFGNADVHHMIHGLRWSPWGDLFFTQSIYINSFVETAHGPRRLNGSGVWRFRPELERLDVYSRGRVNPWGHALNYFGNSFGTDGAGGQGPHDLFPGSAFATAVNAPRVLRGLVPGKPKNTGAEFMTGRHIPSHWHGSLLGNDFRANRTVRYAIEESGSGFKSQEVETVLHSSHRSYRPVDIKMGPDGAVYIVDWYNPIIDHGEVDFHHPLRDKSHGRIWRLTAIDQPLLDWPVIAEATRDELFTHLTAPEQYTRTQANRELVRRKVSRADIDTWIGTLEATAPGYDHHLLEALWLSTALNQKSDGLGDGPLRSADPRIRAAAVRAVGRTAEGLSHLATAVHDEHPRVRLAAVCALRDLGSREASDIVLGALDHEVDLNLDFALEMAVRDTRDAWLPAMQAGQQVFGGDANSLSYALNKVKDKRAIEGLAAIIAQGKLRDEALDNAVSTVSSLGSPEQVGSLLQKAQDNPDWLPAIARGVRYNAKEPPLKIRAMMFLNSKVGDVRVAAADLCGAWKVSSAEDLLARNASKATTVAEAQAMARALAGIGATARLEDLSEEDQSPLLRVAAIAAASRINPSSNADKAAQLLSDLDDPDLAILLMEAFLSRPEGPELLSKALEESRMKEPVALAANRSASASGRNVPELLAALNKAGGLKPFSSSMSPAERSKLLADARASGSAVRGRQIYQRSAMACATCHLVDGKGGKLGPDLSTVGSYMTPESLLESLLNPSTDIKQGYETVVVTRNDQTVVSGLLQRKTDTSVLVRDPSGKVVSIPTGEVAKVDTSPVSLMPPGLTSALRRDELVDLMTFLTSLGVEPAGN